MNLNKPVLDLDKLNELRRLDSANGVGVLKRLLPIYLKSVPKYLSQIEGAIESNDNVELMRAAHTLKSSSVIIGAENLAGLCQKLESLASSHQINEAAQLFSGLQHECAQVTVEVERLLDEYNVQQ